MAMILDGRSLGKTLTIDARKRIASANKAFLPSLSILCIGQDPASKWYNKSIQRVCNRVGIMCSLLEYVGISLEEGHKIVQELLEDSTVHGILINQPLPSKSLYPLIEGISLEKDVEGVSALSLGRLLLDKKTHIPCTPLAVMSLLNHYKVELEGKNVCIIGRSAIVGKPLSILLTKANATVTLCHSRTKDIKSVTSRADIVIVAIGKAEFLTKDFIKEGAIVIDVGTNYTKEGLCGDVDFASVSMKASMISPVPFGVGSLTNLMLVSNIIDAYLSA